MTIVRQINIFSIDTHLVVITNEAKNEKNSNFLFFHKKAGPREAGRLCG